MMKMNNKARRTARELKHLGASIQTTSLHGKMDASRDAEDATRLREMLDDCEQPIGLLEHELLKLRKRKPALYRELRDEFQMQYLG